MTAVLLVERATTPYGVCVCGHETYTRIQGQSLHFCCHREMVQRGRAVCQPCLIAYSTTRRAAS